MEYPIKVKTLTGKILDLQVSSSNTILDIKNKILDLTGTPTEQIRLIYTAKQLEDENTLERYGIKSDAILILVLCLRKPVISLYNYPQDTKVEISLELGERANFSSIYPRPRSFYMDSKKLTWNVNFIHNGKLQFEDNKKDYPYIYYECHWFESIGENEIFNQTCLASENVEEELEKILENMGLNYVERCDFMTYWLPQLTEKKYVFMAFVKDEAYNKIVNLTVNPAPETLTRVIMVFKNTNDFDAEVVSIKKLNKNTEIN